METKLLECKDCRRRFDLLPEDQYLADEVFCPFCRAHNWVVIRDNVKFEDEI